MQIARVYKHPNTHLMYKHLIWSQHIIMLTNKLQVEALKDGWMIDERQRSSMTCQFCRRKSVCFGLVTDSFGVVCIWAILINPTLRPPYIYSRGVGRVDRLCYTNSCYQITDFWSTAKILHIRLKFNDIRIFKIWPKLI